MLKRLLKMLFSRRFWFAVMILLQIVFVLLLAYWFANIGVVAYVALMVVGVVVLVAVLEQDDLNPAYKLMWAVTILIMPVFGALFYVLWGHRHVPRRKRLMMQTMQDSYNSTMEQDTAVMDSLREQDVFLAKNARYLWTQAASPVYPSVYNEYYPIGEAFFPRFLDAIRGAKKFIFMEYYILQPGYMLDTTVEVLRQKVAEGVDVRLMWDGFGSLVTLPGDYIKKMKSYGIQCQAFFPLAVTWHVSDYAMLNHRDHRKITVVDGEIGFSGGLNFADEYINQKERFGIWKDTAFMITGEAVHSLTTTFLLGWDQTRGQADDPERYRVPRLAPPAQMGLETGYVQPYWDSPLDGENVSENAYLNVISHAAQYVYISTPYLIVDHEMITSLTLAAKNGIDVRILTPGIPDKRPVYWVTQGYYPVLLAGGVRIFEYAPGFNHAKMYVSDDKVAIIGSANMDYRSLYLHFENCVAFYGGGVVQDAKRDMLESFALAHEVTLEETRNTPPLRRLFQTVAKFFSPLL